MSNFILVIILTTPITLLPLVHLVTGYEGNALIVVTVAVLAVLLLLTLVFGDNDE